jgi:lipoyl(octanoyl) transferase
MLITPKFKIDNKPQDYEKSVAFMQDYVAKMIAGEEQSLVWITSHLPIYTAGVSAKDEDLLAKSDIPVFKTNRGGQYTYHDAGMRIIYPMIDLKKLFYPQKPDVSKFVLFLEGWIIDILAHFQIKGEIRKDRVGIWVKTADGSEKKIAAIGIKLKKWISYHGIAINLNPNLAAFENIIPCGIKEFGVTSMQDLGVKVNNEEMDEVIKSSFDKILQKRRKIFEN